MGYEKLQNSHYFSSNKSYRVFKQSFTKLKPILLFSIRIEFSKANKVLLKLYKECSACSFGGSLRVQFPLYSYWFRPWLLSWPDFKEEHLEEGDENDVNAN